MSTAFSVPQQQPSASSAPCQQQPSASSAPCADVSDVALDLKGDAAEPQSPSSSSLWDIVRQAWVIRSSNDRYRDIEGRFLRRNIKDTDYTVRDVPLSQDGNAFHKAKHATIRTLDTGNGGNGGNGAGTSTSTPIVLGHGFGSGLGVWAPSLDTFKASLSDAERRVVAFDWLGCAGSSRPAWTASATPDSPTSAEDWYVESLEQWRREMGLNKMVLVGHSLGGYMSGVYAMRYPERVERLVLVSPVGVPRRPAEWADTVQSNARLDEMPWSTRTAIKTARSLWESGVTPHGIVRAAGPLGRRFVAGYVNRRHSGQDEESKELLVEYHYQILSGRSSGENALSEVLSPGAFAKAPLIDRLPAARALPPVSFLYGAHDWMDARAAQELAPHLPGSGGVFRTAGGHMMMLDAPAEFGSALAQIIDEH